MSFTSTLSVGTSTVLVLVVELFLNRPTSMENILQSIVKIIIIGSLCTSINVDCNPQYLPPPLPYYQNDGYFLPGFVPPYHDPLPVFYQQDAPPPISFQNINSFTPPQLFHQNENYHPPQFTNPNVRYMPQTLHYEPNLPQTYTTPQKSTFEAPKINYKQVNVKTSQKKPGFYATNIIIKDEALSPFYQDEFNKNYHDDDYADTYSDEAPSSQDPCVSPYRYFKTPKQSSSVHTLCNPHYEPNSGNKVYTVKMPITLLPSQFPPRVEQLIERIQNYFSTYTQQQTPKPINETSPSTTVPSVTEVISTTEGHSTVMAETGQKKKNTTTEIEELSLEETNSEPTEAEVAPAETSTGVVPEVTTTRNGQVPQKTIVVEIESSDDDGQNQKSHLRVQMPSTVTKLFVSSTESTLSEMQTTERASPKVESTTRMQSSEASAKVSQNQISYELTHPKSTSEPEVVVTSTTHAVTEASNKPEATTTNETLLEVTDKNG